ncbi:MAG: 2-phospho-L-lactate guanylyltransferase [Gammaproteobacteria bacterium]|nr:2-phospho-L-lactate guanylyltransferase [Gammaproteobacteria bacterium]
MNQAGEEPRLPFWAILPVKRIDSAKQRLSEVLSAAERQELFRNMLTDVMAAISHAKSLDGLVVVTRDAEVQILARRYRTRVLATDADEGQSVAVTEAAKILSCEGVQKIVTLPGDVPLIKATEIDTVCNSLPDAPAMGIVPNSDDTGSNCIACSPPNAIPFLFGEMSFPRHLRTAEERHVQTQVMRLPGMVLDIDVVSDLVKLLSFETTTATQRFLISSGIAQRLEKRGLVGRERRAVSTGERVTQ